jgi:hypothetical protein
MRMVHDDRGGERGRDHGKDLAQGRRIGHVLGPDSVNRYVNRIEAILRVDEDAGAQPSGDPVIQRPIPVLRDQPLPIRIVHPAPAPDAKPHPPGTAEFRYWTAAEALRRGADSWGALLPGLSWEVGRILPVDLDFGVDLNAFYDRVGRQWLVETGLRGWGGRTRTQKCRRKLSF